MKVYRKIIGFLMVLAMLVNVIAIDSEVKAQAAETYDVVVSKVKMNSLEGWPKSSADGYTGNKIADLGSYFGSGSTQVAGAYFEVHKGSIDGEVVKSGLTGDDGTIRFSDLPEGKYVITENKALSKYKDDQNNELADSAAVPMEISLPVYKTDGSKYTVGEDALHVYPKSTVSKPSINKFVSESLLADTSMIGEKKNFTILSTMPNGISDYKVLKFTDQMDSGLDYEGNLNVYLDDVLLSLSSDYTVSQETAENGIKKLEISINADKIKTLKANQKIKITYDASINASAVMGKANENNVLVQYTTNANNEAIKVNKTVENPELHTGGIRFKKVDGIDGKGLPGAKFVILSEDKSKYLLKGEDGKLSWTTEDQATEFESGTDGIFEIKGLPYGTSGTKSSEGESVYYIRETKAPTGYAKLTEEYKFVINANSYYNELSSQTLKEPENIKNNKITIPQTGGKGAIGIVVAGFVVVVAGLTLKKKFLNN
ncbi:SpaH/EbpB family LPXTG-anchored major pilin [Peptostreptococcus russellii]|uniref:SpaH/EbpB family LPXTG-anchored major pilin n=1 Tax=Peptostreptococcus russellii TaxID=215200 RepID=UPI001627A67C|nr:SpaH/EbpB family LPXTG-anchored major pilin [Peptostreptococcus russellii]MBC2577918.1 SpaH/EbpB family LPXTG-anchored major pilin [Peptostreptococcus russellii]